MLSIVVMLVVIASSPLTEVTAADCWSNGWSCQDGGCRRSGGSCGTVRRLKGGRPVCRCEYGIFGKGRGGGRRRG